ncbi:hypothetical protein FKM82_021732 [Ascaphus truei]
MPNISKNSDLTSDRLLWSSMIAYIRLALWGCPSGCTVTRHILEQDLPSSPPPHTSVHLDATDVGGGVSPTSSSPPCFVGGLGALLALGFIASGCRAAMCLSLSHSVHFIASLQSLNK